jgi:hypothetical protein
MEPMFNEGQKCIIEFVADDGSQVWFKTRVDRIERGLAVLDITDDLCDMTVWFPNMDGAWDVDGLQARKDGTGFGRKTTNMPALV